MSNVISRLVVRDSDGKVAADVLLFADSLVVAMYPQPDGTFIGQHWTCAGWTREVVLERLSRLADAYSREGLSADFTVCDPSPLDIV